MKVSTIGWTDCSGGKWNPIIGCTPAGPGCANCYAAAWADRWGRDFSQVTTYPDKLAKWATSKLPEYSPKRGAPHKPMVFVVDMGDLFHEDVPDDFIMHALTIMESRYDITWQILTKRAKRMRDILDMGVPDGKPMRDNIWFGVSVSNQATADERIPDLLAARAAVRFVSVEPMLGPVMLWDWMYEVEEPNYVQVSRDMAVDAGYPEMAGREIEWGRPDSQLVSDLDWVICGGESGPNRRPFDKAWALDLYAQCNAAGVPFFFKQGSALKPGRDDLLDGVQVKQWPGAGGKGEDDGAR